MRTVRSISMARVRASAADKTLVALDRLDDLVAHRVGGIERGHRLLEDHGEPRAAHVADGVGVEGQKIAALEADLALHRGVLRRQQAHDGKRRHALAAARFADQSQGAAALQRQVDAVDGAHRAVVGGEGNGKLAQFEQNAH